MRIPGFAVEPATYRANAGDLILPQQFTCEEELGPPCRQHCQGASDFSACVRRCLRRACSNKWR
ncbi:hypothetical protein B7P34_20810 [Streptosporangium nondiastaticum]|uniref:Uncharacterized protein n=1 Tax=Streptosporangium nondiastaticum TaxID=35764 RepID=A0A9X7PG74_9ACTN|nr:hypothetical protein B7P34_20810 [Streptosporangium nondiastaticum]